MTYYGDGSTAAKSSGLHSIALSLGANAPLSTHLERAGETGYSMPRFTKNSSARPRNVEQRPRFLAARDKEG